MAATVDTTTYPRPDWQRTSLAWKSLNGPWDFLFDDQDVGLQQHWATKGLPQEVQLTTVADSSAHDMTEGESITQKIAAGTQELIKNNVFSQSVGVNNKRQIQVPFVFQSPASGINDRGVHEVMWYERHVQDPRDAPAKLAGHRVILRFGAVDYEAKVWIDGHFIGGHRGGHVPWELDVTDVLDSGILPASITSHRLTLRVYDSAYDLTQPRGKQYWAAQPESIFYTPSGGIWQSVWMEVLPAARIADSSNGTVIRSENIETGICTARVAVQGRRAGQKLSVDAEVTLGGVDVTKAMPVTLTHQNNHVSLELPMHLSEEKMLQLDPALVQSAPLQDDSCWRDRVALWSPEHPTLYDLKIRLLDAVDGTVLDTVTTHVGMRNIHWTKGDGHWRLNGKPYFQALVLDQGYWPETFMTPPNAESLKRDIELSKAMGMNGCRKHQKVEDPAFYYWADKLGYLVWGEMANAYQFSSEYVERFDQEWIEAVKLGINHPSIVTWTPVNESWAYTSLKDDIEQRNHIRSLYFKTKTLDPTRSVNDNCGWEHVVTDLTTFHDYSDGPDLAKHSADLAEILNLKAGRPMFCEPIPGVDPGVKHLNGAPIMCTEFGGVNIAAPAAGGKDGEDRDWGYTTATGPEDLLKRIEALMKGIVDGGHCCAFVYTQLADIEQEANGLYSFDRKEKLDATKVKQIVESCLDTFYSRVRT